jgi:hypothetical protein
VEKALESIRYHILLVKCQVEEEERERDRFMEKDLAEYNKKYEFKIIELL